MELTLKRKFLGPNYTIGDLYINNVFFCNTLEDTVRNLPSQCPDTPRGRDCTCSQKIYAQTAIPAGTYKITIEYSPKFKRPLPYLHDVPHFIGILIHSGNTAKDSAGCILVGLNTVKGRLTSSRATSDKLTALLAKEKNITIQIL